MITFFAAGPSAWVSYMRYWEFRFFNNKIAHWADEFSKDALEGKCRSSKYKSADRSGNMINLYLNV